MNVSRLQQILDHFPNIKLLVVGDFFLDKYLHLQRNLSEVSLETGLEAYQVVKIRKLPGAAGTVTANIRQQDSSVVILGVVGDDGNGYDLQAGLSKIGVDISGLIVCPDLFTPTYNKPMMLELDGSEHELNRMDVKNRSPLQENVEDEIIKRLRELVPLVQGVLIVDQVQEANCGVITDRVRAEIERLARGLPTKPFIADSRERAHLFQEVILKTNLAEALKAAGMDPNTETADLSAITSCCEKLYRRTNNPVIITLAEHGCIVFSEPGSPLVQIPAIPVGGPIDVVGAGDSFLASVGLALSSSAELKEAALIGNLSASIVVQQIGTTGTASRAQIISRFNEYHSMIE